MFPSCGALIRFSVIQTIHSASYGRRTVNVFRLLFKGSLWPLPFLFGLALLGLWYVAYAYGKQRDWKRTSRIKYLVLGRALIPVLPLSGIFGTVLGLIETLAFMGSQPSGKIDMPQVVAKFSVALNTTFWGVLFAVLALILYQTALAQLEGAQGEE